MNPSENQATPPREPRRSKPLGFRLHLKLARRIQWLSAAKGPLACAPALCAWLVWGAGVLAAMACAVLGLITWVALNAWELSLRRQFVREAPLPAYLGTKLRSHYPHLSASDADLVLRGMRQFFMAYLRSNKAFVAMPSQVVDMAWHEFILHTRAYEAWCGAAFGKLLHHTPAEVLGRDPKRNDGLRRCWFWACKEESIDPRKPSRLPLLFALDKKLGIAAGFHYLPDCKDIDRQSGSGTQCGSSFGDGSGAAGDADGFGGADSSADGGGGDGGCGGGGD